MVKGIGPKRRERVVSAWAEQQAIREIMVFLQSHGVGTARAVRIYKSRMGGLSNALHRQVQRHAGA